MLPLMAMTLLQAGILSRQNNMLQRQNDLISKIETNRHEHDDELSAETLEPGTRRRTKAAAPVMAPSLEVQKPNRYPPIVESEIIDKEVHEPTRAKLEVHKPNRHHVLYRIQQPRRAQTHTHSVVRSQPIQSCNFNAHHSNASHGIPAARSCSPERGPERQGNPDEANDCNDPARPYSYDLLLLLLLLRHPKWK